MNYLMYLTQLINQVAIDFEFWAIYETSLIEALVGLLAYQLLEDIVLCIFKKDN
jgi:hypothetical protein